MAQSKLNFNGEVFLQTITEDDDSQITESPSDDSSSEKYYSDSTLNVASDSESNVLDSQASACDKEMSVDLNEPLGLKNAKIFIQELDKFELPRILVCGACLGTHSYRGDPLITCVKCGATVHKHCYDWNSQCGVRENEPWLCDPCAVGVVAPKCELCPNKYGIFKVMLTKVEECQRKFKTDDVDETDETDAESDTDVNTDVGIEDEADNADVEDEYEHDLLTAKLKALNQRTNSEKKTKNESFKWVHVVCALYLANRKCWTRGCSLCIDTAYAHFGSRIVCDFSTCRISFHVTCAQAAGLLIEESGASAVPYYALCTLHSHRAIAEARKRNYQVSIHNMRKKMIVNHNDTELAEFDKAEYMLPNIGVECISFVAERKHRLMSLRREINATQMINVVLLSQIAELNEECRKDLLELAAQKRENDAVLRNIKNIIKNIKSAKAKSLQEANEQKINEICLNFKNTKLNEQSKKEAEKLLEKNHELSD